LQKPGNLFFPLELTVGVNPSAIDGAIAGARAEPIRYNIKE